MQKNADIEAPGWVWQDVLGAGARVSIRPWPEYGDHGTPVWSVVVQTPTRRYWLSWSVRLGRWAHSSDWLRIERDMPDRQKIELTFFVGNCLNGALT
jgi:hypothetical protein